MTPTREMWDGGYGYEDSIPHAKVASHKKVLTTLLTVIWKGLVSK